MPKIKIRTAAATTTSRTPIRRTRKWQTNNKHNGSQAAASKERELQRRRCVGERRWAEQKGWGAAKK